MNHAEQPSPIRQPGVPSVQRAVRDDLRLREQVGVERYGTPLQPHNGRDALRDLYEELLDASCYIKQVLIERDAGATGGLDWAVKQIAEQLAEISALRAALVHTRLDRCIDGDLLVMLIEDACPDVLTDEAAHSTAERVVAQLASDHGVTVIRGPDDKPWTPEPVVEAHICCEHA